MHLHGRNCVVNTLKSLHLIGFLMVLYLLYFGRGFCRLNTNPVKASVFWQPHCRGRCWKKSRSRHQTNHLLHHPPLLLLLNHFQQIYDVASDVRDIAVPFVIRISSIIIKFSFP